MLQKRILVATASMAILLLAGAILGFVGVTLCSPRWLPGDWQWFLQQRLADAIELVLSFPNPKTSCFTESSLGWAGITVSTYTLAAVSIVILAFVLSATVAPPALRWRMRKFGGHAIVAGEPAGIELLVEREGKKSSVAFLAVNAGNARRLSWRYWSSLVETGYDSRTLAESLDRIGVARARSVVAASASDVCNMEIATQSVAMTKVTSGRGPDILLLIEHPVLRNLKAHEIARRAAVKLVSLTVVSVSQIQLRRGVRLGIPYKFRAIGARRIHVVVSGSGRLLQQLAAHIAAQAYCLEAELPVLTIVQFGNADIGGGVLHRLQEAKLAAEIRVVVGDAASETGFGITIGQMELDRDPISAIHCVGESPGEAEAYAGAWERNLLELGLPVPTCVIYPSIDRAKSSLEFSGASGMFKWASPINLAEARREAAIIDEHAQLIHRNYQQQQVAAGSEVQRSHADWPELPGAYQDDNRAVADHLDTKLTIIGCRTANGAASPAAQIQPDEVEILAAVEHARWVAKRSIEGWKFSPLRDDIRRGHPSIIPYGDLPESEKQKDRENIKLIPELLRLVDRRVVRDFNCAILLSDQDDMVGVFDMLAQPLVTFAGRHPDRHLVIWLPFRSGTLAVAEALGSAGLSIALVDDGRTDAASGDTGQIDGESLARVRSVADRIEVLGRDYRATCGIGATEHLIAVSDGLIEEAGLKISSTGRPTAVWSKENGFTDLGWLG
jgi:hypothetical protein